MDIGEHKRSADEYTTGTQVAHNNNNNNNSNMLAPQQQQPQPAILLQDNEPWRGSSGFGLANILNRSMGASTSSAGSSNGSVGGPTLPKISLPSLHSFGKSLPSVKPELAQHSMLKPQQRSPPTTSVSSSSGSGPLGGLDAVRENPRPLAIHTSDPSERNAAATSPPSSKETTPRKGNNNNSARRIAPAPADEDEGEQDEDSLSGSIRGGRWTADEHERFLSGFRIHGHKWKRVQQVVRTRSVTQVRTHAQKYLLKVAKLKAEKKGQGGKAIDVSALNDRYLSGRGADSSSDAEQGGNTAPSSPDNAGAKGGGSVRYYDDSFDATERSPKPQRKKARQQQQQHVEHQHVDVLDQEYIAAAATTLCFLMSQKIDSLFDNRNDMDKDLEPYDCYSDQPSAVVVVTTAAGSTVTGDDASDKSRKRAYMHFLTESPVQYPADGSHFSYDESDQRAETPSYAIEGKKLYS